MLFSRLLSLCAALSGLALGGQIPAGNFYIESSGVARGQAEDYHALRASAGGANWTRATAGIAAAGGGAFMQVPEAAAAAAGWQQGAAIDYRIKITTPGVYRLWLKWSGTSAGSDSLYAGVLEAGDGAGGAPDYYVDATHAAADFSDPGWDESGEAEADTDAPVQSPMTWTLAAGEHTLRVVAREDGVALDEWALQLSALSAPEPITASLSNEVVGRESFNYPNGPIGGKTGGEGFDRDNSTDNNPFIGHTGVTSNWNNVTGTPGVTAGRLITSNSAAKREYNGITEGTNADERAGAIHGGANANAKAVYFRFNMTRDASATWSGLSSYDFGNERILFGVPNAQNPVTARRELGIHILNGGEAGHHYSGVAPVAGTTYQLVGKIDFAGQVLKFWINPDINLPEASNTVAATCPYTTNNWSSSARFGSGSDGNGTVQWDDLFITTTWGALATGDRDHDGMPDVWEIANGLLPTLDDANLDPDGDGQNNLAEYQSGINPQLADTDNDGLDDGEEIALGTNPLVGDTDGDGLPDGAETGTGIFVNAADAGTNPLVADSDGDTISDGVEVNLGTNPNDSESAPELGGVSLIGYEDFNYPDGAITARDGGFLFDIDNSFADDAFVGPDGTKSAWINITGAPTVTAGRLITNNTATRRPFNGPAAGVGTEEADGAIGTGRPASVIYFRAKMTRSASAGWGGISCYHYGAEKLFFGVTSGVAANDLLGMGETGVGDSNSTVPVADGTECEVVGKVDTNTKVAMMWVNPDFMAGEASNTPLATRVLASSFEITSLRLGSGGEVAWDNLHVATDWSSLIAISPTALPDGVTLHRGQKVRLDVLANDHGAFDTQQFEIVTPPSAGTATILNDRSILYTHNGGAEGADSFVYRLPSLIPGGNPAEATVTVTATEQLRIPNATLKVPADPPRLGFVALDAFPGVTFINPTAIAKVAGDTKRLFIGERNGKIWLIPDVTASAPTKQLYLDVAAVVNARTNEAFIDDGNERGLKSIAFHPQYAANGRLFVTYCLTIGGVKQVRLSEFAATGGTAVAADPASEKAMITQLHKDTIHNIDDIVFGPDNYLYLSAGDEGPQNDGNNNSQRIDKDFWSAIFRLDVDRKPGSLEPNAHPSIIIDPGTSKARYAVPADNPFIGATSFNGTAVDPANVRTEIYALGFRNPWQMNFDAVNGDLWVGDVGNATMEEIDRVVIGGNYQWGYKEGTGNGPKPLPAGFAGNPPVYAYTHGGGSFEGKSVTGGLIVRGGRYPGIEGRYLFSDYISGHIWTLENPSSGTPTVERIAGEVGIVAFDTDPSNGDVLMVDFNDGRILRLGQAADDSTFPALLSKTGIFADLADLSPNPGILPYEINLPFWSDHAKKRRWFTMPDVASSAGFQVEGNWTLPAGAIWVKHFDMEMVRGNPATKKRIETRLFVKNASGAYGVSYRWNNSGTEAFLVPDVGVNFPLEISENGSTHTQTWAIPGRSQCMTCHTPAGGHALSFETRQLNREGSIASASGNYLSLLRAAGYLDQTVPAGLPRHHAPEETQYSLETRARSWLAVNCSYCHQPGGGGLGGFDLSAHLGLFETGIIDGEIGNSAGDPADRLVVRGDPAHSAILSRMAATNGYTRMPPLATSVVDAVGVEVVRDWILGELENRLTYEEWRLQHFTAGNPDGDPAADPDGDGEANRFEFLAHTDPNLGSSRWAGGLKQASGQMTLEWPNSPDRSIRAWTSTDLTNWEPWNVPGNDGVPRAGTGTRSFPVGMDESKRFFRFLLED